MKLTPKMIELYNIVTVVKNVKKCEGNEKKNLKLINQLKLKFRMVLCMDILLA